MNIQPYIAQLLYRYQCVTVPGFGAFLTEIQSAQLTESSHSFFPPKKIISFNGQLQNNDGLLANHIAQAEKTSYEYNENKITNIDTRVCCDASDTPTRAPPGAPLILACHG